LDNQSNRCHGRRMQWNWNRKSNAINKSVALSLSLSLSLLLAPMLETSITDSHRIYPTCREDRRGSAETRSRVRSRISPTRASRPAARECRSCESRENDFASPLRGRREGVDGRALAKRSLYHRFLALSPRCFLCI